MTQAEYNKEVQECQRWPIQYRIRQDWFKSAALPAHINPHLYAAHFEVYWGKWQTLGTQYYPFKPECHYEWNDVLAVRILAEIGLELSKG